MSDDKNQAQESLKDLPVKVGQKYRHFKGGEYEIVALAVEEHTLQPLVIYRRLAKGYNWARTMENFTEYVEREGKRLKRFERI